MDLWLDRPALADVDTITAALQEASLADMLTSVPPDYSRSNAVAFVTEMAGPDDLAVRLGETLIGMVRCDGELGYWIAPEYQGQGLGYRAAELALARSFTAPRNEVIAVHLDGNHRSRGLLRKLGFVPAGPVTLQSKRLGAHPGQKLTLSRADYEHRLAL